MVDGKTIDERISEACERVGKAIGDGFDPADLGVIVREAVEVAEAIGELHSLDGPGKRAVAVILFNRFVELAQPHLQRAIDLLVDTTDGPGPDVIVDPLAKRVAPMVVVKMFEMFGPGILDLVVEASAGRVKVNSGVEG